MKKYKRQKRRNIEETRKIKRRNIKRYTKDKKEKNNIKKKKQEK